MCIYIYLYIYLDLYLDIYLHRKFDFMCGMLIFSSVFKLTLSFELICSDFLGSITVATSLLDKDYLSTILRIALILFGYPIIKENKEKLKYGN